MAIVLAGGFSDGELVKSLHGGQASNMEELYSTQEEADTRLLLHAIHASQNHSRVIIRYDDTDVMILLIYYCSLGQLSEEVFMHAGHSGKNVTNERYVPIHTIAEKLTEDVCSIIPAVHALSGCDTNSSLHGLGKWTVYNVITKTAKDMEGLVHYEDRDEFLVSARRFVLLLHGKNAKCQASLDDLRYHLATTTDKPANQLPPSEDAFEQHVLRAQYQVQIWNQSIYQNLKWQVL